MTAHAQLCAVRMRTLFLVLVLLPLCARSQTALDSLLRVLPGKHGADRVKTLGDVQWELAFSDPERALIYGLDAMKLAEGLKDSAVIAQAANDLSITEFRLGHFQRSIDLSRRALRIRTVLQDTLGVAASHNKIGAAFIEINAYDSALAHNYAAARIYEQRGDVLHAAQVRGNLSRLYSMLGNTTMALKVSRETVAMLESTADNDYAMANALGQLANILVDTKDWDGTEATSLRALALFEELDMKGEVGTVANILGLVSRNRGDDAAALRYYRQALQMAVETDDPIGQATFMTNVANVLVVQSELAEAEQLYRDGMAISEREGYLDQRIANLAGLVALLEKRGDVKEAFRLSKELVALKDSAHNAERIEAVSELQVKYETERTEKELAQERERTVQQEAEIDRRRVLQGLLVIGIVMVALLAFLFLSRQRARATAQLNATVIAEREQGLKALVESTDAERKRIAAELHDGVGQQLSGLKFRLEGAATERPELMELVSIADDASREVRGIAHQMMPRALGDLGLVPALTDMLHKALARPGITYSFEHFGVEARLPQAVEVGVYRIAQELITNVIKHAQARNVQVQLLKNKAHLVLIVEDDGIGIDPARKEGGLGMRSVNDRARLLHGTIDLSAGATGGTVCTLRVPTTNGNHN